jgi:hypothetical protein
MPSDRTAARDWSELTQLTQGRAIVVERIRLADSGIVVEGAFALPELARLTLEDQVFIAAFVRSHGSIKEMEQVFGVSYPTIKARLNRIAGLLSFMDVTPPPPVATPGAAPGDVLERLSRGEITAQAAIAELEARK